MESTLRKNSYYIASVKKNSMLYSLDERKDAWRLLPSLVFGRHLVLFLRIFNIKLLENVEGLLGVRNDTTTLVLSDVSWEEIDPRCGSIWRGEDAPIGSSELPFGVFEQLWERP